MITTTLSVKTLQTKITTTYYIFCCIHQFLRRQNQGMDGPGVRQVPEGSGERGKMEETGCEIICGVPTTLTIKV